jgi:hypothetical protein
MRALVAEAETLYAMRIVDALTNAGISVLGPARSSGEALMLATIEQPDVVILRADLESVGVGQRLAQKLDAELNIRCVFAEKHELDHPVPPPMSFATDRDSLIVSAARGSAPKSSSCPTDPACP